MKLINLGTNVTEIQKNDGTQILFSYETPVAFNKVGEPCLITEEKFSRTTTKHINEWADELNIEYVSQQKIVDLCNKNLGA